jgi:two-component system, chemotaxis family, sensor kinase CheA
MIKRILRGIVLPERITDFERQYLNRMNRIGLWFFALHIPVFVLIAQLNDTGPLLAAALGLATLIGPLLAYRTFRNPRSVSLTYGFTSMLMGGILVHVGQGPVQIEMHFYFFALIAMLAVYANPLVILVAAVTVALHHLAMWLVLPTSVFNYDAPIWVVAVHAAFVVLESVATCYIARSFFDNVIGLEKIVQARTAELAARTRDMRLVLDHVDQGFITIDRNGVMSPERSAIVEKWLGPSGPHATFAEYLSGSSPIVAETFELGLSEVNDGVLPLEVTLGQLPQRFGIKGRSFSIAYTPILEDGELEKLLIVITDISSVVERERLQREQREMLHMFEQLTRDRSGFLEFFEETRDLVKAVERNEIVDLTHLKRVIHTLKGNAAIFGMPSMSDKCHELETMIEETQERPPLEQRNELVALFDRMRANLDTLLGNDARKRIEVEPTEYEQALLRAAKVDSHGELVRLISAWKLEPSARRLERIAEQAQRIATRLNKGPLAVVIRDNGLRLEPARWASFWSAFVHVVRNAVDHGLESEVERLANGKSERGKLELVTRLDRHEFVIEIKDDGRGVDWSAIAERAKNAGLPHRTSQELVAAVFADGISTAPYISELSGRGVGMGAVRAECEARGGTVELVSEPAAGTRVVFRFPAAAMTGVIRAAA